jgi:hypothetical protein
VTAPSASICGAWATTDDLCDPCNSYESDLLALDDALEVASNILYRLTGRQWAGCCTDTVRPCAQTHRYDIGRPIPAYPAFPTETGFYNRPPWGWCSCNSVDSCSCRRLPAIDLGVYPLTEVTEVLVDGVALDPSAYRIDDWRWLARVDDEPWPCCQRMDLASTEPNTWEITFTYGQAPPADGVRAAALLACELYKACTGGGDCQLDPRVRSVVREGITLDLETISGTIGGVSGRQTGVPFVDLFVASVNPTGARSNAVVYNPSRMGAHVRRVGT